MGDSTRQYVDGRDRLTKIGREERSPSLDDDHFVEVFDTADWPRLEKPADGPPSWLADRWRAVRFDPERHGATALVVVGMIALAVVGFSVWRDRPVAHAVPALPPVETVESIVTPPEPVLPDASKPPAEPPTLVVSVVGLVHVPGLVQLPDGARIADALAAAGGVREGGDTLTLNLAQPLADGDQVVVGVESGEPLVSEGPAGPRGAGGSAAAAAPEVVNLNSADEGTLETLPGVGPVTAAAIVAWRTSNGKFVSVDQLGEVDGIGPVRLGKLRSLVAV